MSENRVCFRCKKAENFKEDPNSELRPYGPNGEDVCFGCASGSGADFEAAVRKKMEDAVNKAFDQADEAGGGIVVFGDGPPQFVGPEQTKEN